ncbi:MAG: F0F1 ATP synthase subunit A, partial [Chitinophagales bacterium]|nr:F0F1 ATP synthase subunit A [Chitinophagales bacterium]
MKSLIKYALSLLLGWMFLAPIQAKASGGEGEYDAKEFAMHHVADAHEWHIVGGFTIPLPCIVIHDGLHVFMSNKMPEAHHGGEEPATAEHHETYQGFYYNESGKIVHEDGGFTLDMSITKNVATLLLVSLIMIWLFTSVAKAYSRREGQAPKGVQSLMEPLILFVRDEVVKPNLGNKSDRYLPYLLTVF